MSNIWAPGSCSRLSTSKQRNISQYHRRSWSDSVGISITNNSNCHQRYIKIYYCNTCYTFQIAVIEYNNNIYDLNCRSTQLTARPPYCLHINVVVRPKLLNKLYNFRIIWQLFGKRSWLQELIEVFKIITNKDNHGNCTLTLHKDLVTRGNRYKLYQKHVNYDLRKYFFC